MKRLIPAAVREAKGPRAKLSALFLEKNEDSGLQFFRYLFVGGASFLADTLTLMVVSQFVATKWIYVSIGYAVGIAVNFLLGKWMVFQKKRKHPSLEFLVTAGISVIGLFLTNWLFALFFDWFAGAGADAAKLIAKVIAAGLVLIWNFLARKGYYAFLDRVEKE